MALKNVKSLAEGHRARLREKFLAKGLKKFTDEEILELLLSFGTPRKDCKHIARNMLKKIGSLREVLEAPINILAEIKGAGLVNTFSIKFIEEISGNFLEKSIHTLPYLNSSESVFKYLKDEDITLSNTKINIFYLNSGNELIKSEIVDKIDSDVYIEIDKILTSCLEIRATGLILAHKNSKNQFSKKDQKTTKNLIQAAYLMDIYIYDHIISDGKDNFFSFRNSGFISELEAWFKHYYQSSKINNN